MVASINCPCFSMSLEGFTCLNPLQWVFCGSPQFIRGRCLDATPFYCIGSKCFKTPTRLDPKREKGLGDEGKPNSNYKVSEILY